MSNTTRAGSGPTGEGLWCAGEGALRGLNRLAVRRCNLENPDRNQGGKCRTESGAIYFA